jgi:predicted nucleic acid-binding protein
MESSRVREACSPRRRAASHWAWPVVPASSALILEACGTAGRHRVSFWDALIWAAADAAGAPYVLSEDFQHGRTIGGVRFINPFREDFDLAEVIGA